MDELEPVGSASMESRAEPSAAEPRAGQPGTAGELARIRAVYRQRDAAAARGRGAAIAEAYRRLNEQRLAKMRRVLERLFRGARPDRPPAERPRLLDVGCGGGYDLSRWRAAGWPADRLAGTDIVEDRLEAASRTAPDVRLVLSPGARLPFPDDSFDVATAVTVFSSILNRGLRRALFAEMERVVRPGGAILVYDFVVRKPTNPHVTGMPRNRLTELAGRPPDASWRLSPLLQLVALGARLGPRAADVAFLLAPPTHRLSVWRVRR